MDIENSIRNLARSNFWQNVYRASKEVGSIQLFTNSSDLSGLQNLFIFWLNVYDSLYTDLAQKEWKYLDEKVIENNTRCDAFLYWRSQMREAEILKHKQEEKENNLKFKSKGNVSTFDVDFKGGN